MNPPITNVDDPDSLLDSRRNNIRNHRRNAHECLQKQVAKMMKLSSNKFPPTEIGCTTRLPIPDVDRAWGSPRKVLARVMDVDNDFYTLDNFFPGIVLFEY